MGPIGPVAASARRVRHAAVRKQTRYVAALAVLILGAGALASCKENPPTTFATSVSWTAGTNPDSVALVDVTADGVVDVVAGTMDGLVVRPGTPGSFGAATVYPLSAYGVPRSIAHGDLDGDGHVDVVATVQNRVDHWEEDGGSLVARTPRILDANVVAIDDVTGDGRDDLVVLGWSSDRLSVFAQTAAGTHAPPVAYTVDVGGWNDLEIGDVDGDKDLDVVAMSGQVYATPDLHVLLQQPDGTLAVRGSWSVPGGSVNANGVGVGNVDQDAPAEVVVSHGGNGSTAKVTVFEADATGGLTEGATIAVKDVPTPIELVDLNGDGHDDAAIGHSGWDTVSVIYGGHSGLAGQVHEHAAGDGSMGAGSLAAADVDGDGDVDLGVVTNRGGLTLLRNTGVPEVDPTTTTTLTTVTTTTSTSVPPTSTSTTTTTTPLPTAGPVEAIATGPGVGCAVIYDTTVECWGWNSSGQLGDGTTTNRNLPGAVTGLDGVADVSIGYVFTCATTSQQTVFCWGDNSYGQLARPATVAMSSTPIEVTGVEDAVAVSAGFRHACAVRQTGSVVCWGENENGQLGDGSTTDRRTPVAVVGIDDAVAVVTGSSHSCALSDDGVVSCWGADDFGALGNGAAGASLTPVAVSGLTDATSLSGEWNTTCVTRQDGTAACWGMNNARQVGDGTTTNRNSPTQVIGLSDVAQVSAGTQHACAVDGGGTSYCWGFNPNGQLGDGTTASRYTPTPVPGLSGGEVRPASDHTCAVDGYGNAFCWGKGSSGALGNGQWNDSHIPSPVAFQH